MEIFLDVGVGITETRGRLFLILTRLGLDFQNGWLRQSAGAVRDCGCQSGIKGEDGADGAAEGDAGDGGEPDSVPVTLRVLFFWKSISNPAGPKVRTGVGPSRAGALWAPRTMVATKARMRFM